MERVVLRAARRAARSRRRASSTMAEVPHVFVSKHTSIPTSDVEKYVRTRIVAAGGSTQAMRVSRSQTDVEIKECPPGFCACARRPLLLRARACLSRRHLIVSASSGSPAKFEGRGKRGNDWKFNVLREGGCYHCFRCGASGSWYDLRLKMSGAEQMPTSGGAVV